MKASSHTHYISAGGLRVVQFTNADDDAIRASELVGAGFTVEVDYVGPELAPVLRIRSPGGDTIDVAVGGYLVQTDDGEVGEISGDDFRASVAPMPAPDAAPARGLIPNPPQSAQPDVEHVFSYHEGHPEDGPRYDALRTHAKAFARAILAHVPSGADQAAAFRKVREALATAIAGVVLARPGADAADAPAPATPHAGQDSR